MNIAYIVRTVFIVGITSETADQSLCLTQLFIIRYSNKTVNTVEEKAAIDDNWNNLLLLTAECKFIKVKTTLIMPNNIHIKSPSLKRRLYLG